MAELRRLVGLARTYYREFVEALRDFEEGRERIYAVERLAQLIAQAILDAAALLAASEGREKPPTYREAARWLARRLGLSGELEEFLVGLAGFRNILVHLYAELREDLEVEAFREIAERTPRVLEKLESVAARDPCLEDVRERLVRAAREIKPRYMLISGSLARRGCGRDVDVAVKLGRRVRSALELGRVQAVLEDYVGTPVDLVVVDLLEDPVLGGRIALEGVLVYGDAREAERDRVRLLSLYMDYAEFVEKVRMRRLKGSEGGRVGF